MCKCAARLSSVGIGQFLLLSLLTSGCGDPRDKVQDLRSKPAAATGASEQASGLDLLDVANPLRRYSGHALDGVIFRYSGNHLGAAAVMTYTGPGENDA